MVLTLEDINTKSSLPKNRFQEHEDKNTLCNEPNASLPITVGWQRRCTLARKIKQACLYPRK